MHKRRSKGSSRQNGGGKKSEKAFIDHKTRRFYLRKVFQNETVNCPSTETKIRKAFLYLADRDKANVDEKQVMKTFE